MALSGSIGHRHGFRWWQGQWILAHTPAVAHITNRKMASGNSMNSGDLLRRPNSENETLSPVCALFHFPIVPTSPAHICSSECYCKLQCVTHLCFFFVFCFFFSPQTALLAKILIAKSHWSGSRFPVSNKYWTIAKAHFGLLTIAQSQGDLATRQGIWGQDSCELLVTAYLFTLGVSHPELCLQPARSAAAPSSPLVKTSSVGCSRGDSMLWAGTIGYVMFFAAATLPHTVPIPFIPQFLHGSWWADSQGGRGHQLSSSISHLCTKLHMAAVDCRCGLLQDTRSSLYNFYSFCTIRVKLLFFIPLVVKNENDFAVYCIALLEFLVFRGTHIVGYPEVCSATLMNM